MTSGGKRPSGLPAEPYSPRRRSALVFVGTGTAGAYHAGVQRALHEAGVKIDMVAGRGMGVVSALLTAVDAAGALWSDGGFWRPSAPVRLYAWHPVVRLMALGLAAAAIIMLAPIALLAAGVAVSAADFAARLVGLSGGGLARGFAGVASALLDSTALPTWLPRFAVVAIGGPALVAFLSALARARAWRHRAPVWRRLVPPLLTAHAAVERSWSTVWSVMRGAADVRRPAGRDLAGRYMDLLAENLGQPGFCELIVGAHDLDTHRDIVFAAVSDDRRGLLVPSDAAGETDLRRGEVVDLWSHAGGHLADAVAAALAVPVVTEPHRTTFEADSYWRGETHRLCDRPGVVHRLVSELWSLGVEQIVLVSSAAEVLAPHALASPRLDGRGRIGEYVESSEAACVREVARAAARAKRPLYVIRPSHNPVGPFDFEGGFDDRSNRLQSVAELMALGYEDAFRQFVEPIVAPSGERLG